jgi:hypothetical protein
MSVGDTGVQWPVTQPSSLLAAIRQGFAAHGIYLLLATLYFASFKIAEYLNPAVVDKEPMQAVVGIAGSSVPVAVICMIVIQFYKVATVDKSKSPTKDLFRRMKGVFSHRDTLARGIPMYVSVLLFMYTFTIYKANISNFIPFSWDVTFDHWDKAMHFGVRPWELLQPVFGNIPATLMLNVNYNVWFIIMKVFWVYFAFVHAPGVERTRFWISYMLIWSLGGTGLAIWFSSVGPCFYGLLIDGVDPYAPLLSQLRGFNTVVPIWAVDTQDFLWQYRLEQSALGGVTAMPSMHNATALLFVLLAWNWGKIWRWAMITHAVLIYLGSIHLGWHYAVDSYLAWAITLACWAIGHKVAVWWNARSAVASFNQQYSSTY